MIKRPAVALGLAVALALVAAPGGPAPDAPRAGGAGPGGAPVSYARPLDGAPPLVHPFEAPPQPWSAGHRGVDLAAPLGAPVLSPASGVVTFAGIVAGRGVVTIAHDDGLRSSLEPLAATVHVGDRVSGGAVVGTLTAQASHCAPATCLHWGVRRGATYLDPLELLPGSGPIVLLPLG